MAFPTSATFWLEGLTASSVILVAVITGLISFYKSRKLNAKLLSYLGLTIFFIGLLYLGPFTDFMSVLITDINIEVPPFTIGIYGLLSYMWIGPAIVLAMYIGGELLTPKRKWIIVIVFAAIGVIFEYFLWFYTLETFNFDLPSPGNEVIDSSFVTTFPTFLLMALFIISVLVFNGIGFLIKGIKSTGVLRRKFILLGLGFIVFTVTGAGDSLVNPNIALVIVRLGMISSIILMYYGLKT
jgi:hypothetical protein